MYIHIHVEYIWSISMYNMWNINTYVYIYMYIYIYMKIYAKLFVVGNTSPDP